MRMTIVTLLACIAAGSVAAQQAPPARRPAPARVAVTFLQLKPDRAAAWDAVMKAKVVPALKKAGVAWHHVWTSGAFGQHDTRVVLQPLGAYGELDAPGALERTLGAAGGAAVATELREALVESRTIAMTRRPEVSIDSGSSEFPSLLHVSFRQTLPGKAGEFVSVMAADFVPNFRKTGIKDYWVYQSSFGAPNGLFMIVRPIAGYAALEEPSMMSQTLGNEASAPAYSRFNPLQTSTEFDIFRFVPDLSFGMPGGAR